MRVLICDQETEMLETIARTFEVDVATSKVTCIDLMRANPFDVVVASERLSDGSGLELLSHLATRWPQTLRVLVIEPDRLKLLRGKLGPFRLHATMKYPIDEDELETVMNRLYPLLETPPEEEDEEEPAPSPPPRLASPAASRPAPPTVAPPTARIQKPVPGQVPGMGSSGPVPGGRPGVAGGSGAGWSAGSVAGSAAASGVRSGKPVPGGKTASAGKSTSARSAPLGAPKNEPVPVKRRLGNYTPLGSPEDSKMRIVEREFDHSAAPLAARAIRTREEAARAKTPAEKAKTLAAQVSNTLRRLLKR